MSYYDAWLLPWTLTWTEVDPATHPFDPAAVRAVVGSLDPAGALSTTGRDFDGLGWTEAITRSLGGYYGRWVVGWRWAADDADIGGGPITSWCCSIDSITTPTETLDKVAAALIEWRGWLEDLAERFARYPADDLEAQWYRAAVHLITEVSIRTEASDAWYKTAETVLRWYLTREGIPEDDAAAMIGEVMGGQFQSWLEPSESEVERVSRQLAGDLARRDH